MSNFNMFGVDCAGCDGDADKDVTVRNATTGKVVKDVFACDSCVDNISVSDDYAVSVAAL